MAPSSWPWQCALARAVSPCIVVSLLDHKTMADQSLSSPELWSFSETFIAEVLRQPGTALGVALQVIMLEAAMAVLGWAANNRWHKGDFGYKEWPFGHYNTVIGPASRGVITDISLLIDYATSILNACAETASAPGIASASFKNTCMCLSSYMFSWK